MVSPGRLGEGHSVGKYAVQLCGRRHGVEHGDSQWPDVERQHVLWRLHAPGVAPPIPLGTTTAQPPPVTGPTFNVFVLMTTRRARCVPGEQKRAREGGGPPR